MSIYAGVRHVRAKGQSLWANFYVRYVGMPDTNYVVRCEVCGGYHAYDYDCENK